MLYDFSNLTAFYFCSWNIRSRGIYLDSTDWRLRNHKGKRGSSLSALNSVDYILISIWSWDLSSRRSVMTPTNSSFFPKNKSFLVFPSLTLPQSSCVACPVLVVFQDLSCSSRIRCFKQSLMDLNSLEHLKGIVFPATSERLNPSVFQFLFISIWLDTQMDFTSLQNFKQCDFVWACTDSIYCSWLSTRGLRDLLVRTEAQLAFSVILKISTWKTEL